MAAEMPKLCTFNETYDHHDSMGTVYTHLSRRQRSSIIRLKIGILPLGVEIGRFTDKQLEYQTCHICNSGYLENEYHFLPYCDSLESVRSKYFAEHNYLEDLDDPTDNVALFKLMLNSHNLKHLGRFLEEMFDLRQKILYH